MAVDANTGLRLKGPLSKPTNANNATYHVNPSKAGEMNFEVRQLGKKSRRKDGQTIHFDSSRVLSPFLDPKIIERRIRAAKRASQNPS